MFSSALALLLMVTPGAPTPDATAPARKAYSACLNDLIRTELASKAKPTTFDAQVINACLDKKEALKVAVLNNERTNGASQEVAEETAANEVQDHQDNARILYRDYLETGSKPNP